MFDTETAQVVNSWPAQQGVCAKPDELPIAVDTTVRTVGYTNFPMIPPHSLGSQYTLDGMYTGVIYANPIPSPARFRDSTTDTLHNYLVDSESGIVYQTELDYTNPVALFTAANGPWLWITYDPLHDVLWLNGATVAAFDFDGTLLSSFDATGTALAFDPEDGSLWLTYPRPAVSLLDLNEYSVDGQLLQTVTFDFNLYEYCAPGTCKPLIEEIYGGEFAEVGPDPETAKLRRPKHQ